MCHDESEGGCVMVRGCVVCVCVCDGESEGVCVLVRG